MVNYPTRDLCSIGYFMCRMTKNNHVVLGYKCAKSIHLDLHCITSNKKFSAVKLCKKYIT